MPIPNVTMTTPEIFFYKSIFNSTIGQYLIKYKHNILKI